MTRSMNTKIVTYLAHLVSIEKVENQICVCFTISEKNQLNAAQTKNKYHVIKKYPEVFGF